MRKVPKVNYSEIAQTYDISRKIWERNLELWLEIIKRWVDEEQFEGEIRFLDLGGGTGRFALPIAERLGYRVTCSDLSREMLSMGMEKDVDGKVTWDQQDAQSLAFPDESFDVVFISLLLHHVDDPEKVIAEGCRVLRKGGIILNRFPPIEHLVTDPEHHFFPEAVEINKARIPTREQIERWCSDAGLENIKTETIVQKTWPNAHERLKATEMKNTSTLHILYQKNPEAFFRGLKALETYVTEKPEDPWLVTDKISISKSRKPRGRDDQSRARERIMCE